MGGVCTNDGCVPTRVLAKAARLVRDGEQFGLYGLVGQRPEVDFPALLQKTRGLVDRIHEKKQLKGHLDRSGISVFEGTARFVDRERIVVGDETEIQGAKFLLCAGGHARRLPFAGAEWALTHSDVWSLRKLPRSVAVVGGAATGCQLASVFAAFGAEVRLLDLAPRLLPGEDEDVSGAITDAFHGHGIEIITGIGGVERLEKDGAMIRFHYTHGGEPRMLDVEAVMLAVGWPGNLEGLNLEAARIETARSYVVVDDHLRTSAPNIFAAGDITGRMMLVQSATFEARIAAENAVLDAGLSFSHQIVPHGGFTDPEYGSVGLTEQAAKAGNHDYAVATIPYTDLDRAVIDGRTEGFCKLIISRQSRQILGAHVVGEQAVEVVQLVAAGMAAGTRIEQLAQLELAYPTFTAIAGLAARQLVRELGDVPLAPEWRALGDPRSVEWERTEV
jgi:pyruvate/2-oxoglutarate dehydrogenase complex dihydrolipoamide dehydrogenase (E3) component